LRRNGRQKGVVGKLRNGKEDTIMALELTSSAISANQPIPKMYTCEGEGISPPLAWSGVLQNTAVFALIVDDPDAPRGVFTHWVLFNLSSDISQLEVSIPRTDRLENGASQGRNDFGDIGYGAPCPPKGDAPHHYRFTLYALDAPLLLDPGATKQQTLDAIQGHVLDQAHLVGTYARPG
jgi:Raf kinase inhibitor-like YbhB/YbcL family protein